MASATRPASVRATSQLFAVLRMTDTAEQLLRNAREPVHLREIATQLMASGKTFTAKKSEASVLVMMAKDRRFRNTGRGKWAVV